MGGIGTDFAYFRLKKWKFSASQKWPILNPKIRKIGTYTPHIGPKKLSDVGLAPADLPQKLQPDWGRLGRFLGFFDLKTAIFSHFRGFFSKITVFEPLYPP